MKKNAIGYVSSVVIGVASTAPGYSLAAVLGFVVLEVGFQAPAIMIVSFLPMLFIAMAYLYMNRADPDCGTTFAWVTNAMGPWWGWIAGWAIVVADIIVMANLAEIAGLYTYLLFGWDDSSTFAIVSLGVFWIAIMTTITTIGIELSARTQRFLLGAELITLALFAVVALVKVYGGDALAGSAEPELSWFSPFAIDGGSGALVAGVLIGVFIYWGWDSLVTVNEETEDSENVPGRAAIMSTLILVGIYVLVSVAAWPSAAPSSSRRTRTRKTPWRPRHVRARGPMGQARDHRGTHVGGRVDADHDPADRAHDALRWPSRRRCRTPSARCTRAS